MLHKDLHLYDYGIMTMAEKESKGLEDLFKDFGLRPTTVAVMEQMGFTARTLINMTDVELEYLIKTLIETYHLDLLVGERFGIKSAVRAQKRILDEEMERQRFQAATKCENKRRATENAWERGSSRAGTSFKGGLRNCQIISELPPPMHNTIFNSNELALLDQGHASMVTAGLLSPLTGDTSESDDNTVGRKKEKRRWKPREPGEDGEERPREHPFVVTESGEPARGKKNGLDYLFDLYEQAGKFLEEVQQISREKGEKCPTKVTNQVFRHAKHKGAGHINKPKMRQYVHCYALHCLDVNQSDGLRRVCKERGENVGSWCQACYTPLISMARENAWDIEGLFNRHDKLRIWYVPKKLIQLCHQERAKHFQ